MGVSFDITHIKVFASFYQQQVWELENKLNAAPPGSPPGGEITSTFGYHRNPFTGGGKDFHSGIDYRGCVGDNIKTTGVELSPLLDSRPDTEGASSLNTKKTTDTLRISQANRCKKRERVNSGQLETGYHNGREGSSKQNTGERSAYYLRKYYRHNQKQGVYFKVYRVGPGRYLL